MSPGEFLRAVWPADGLYCLAMPWTTPDGANVYRHRVCGSISEAVSYVLEQRGRTDLFFAVHTLKARSVFNPDKVNRKTGEKGADEIRVHRNMAECKVFFWDIDVGAGDKYPDQRTALSALIGFCKTTGLPKPLVTSSGGGLHVYWLLTDPIESMSWRDHAHRLRELARHYGLKIDGMRTTDVSSVLRVAGTFNWKDRSNPREVQALTSAQPTANGVFLKALSDALIRAEVNPRPLPKQSGGVDPVLGSNTTREYDGPPVKMAAVLKACPQMARIAMLRGKFEEPVWYHGAIGVGRFTDNGNRTAHRLSSGHSEYSEEACNAKIAQHEERSGPTPCWKLREVTKTDEPCMGCAFLDKVGNPLQAGRLLDTAPPPVVDTGTPEAPNTTAIPEPPYPFRRLSDGGVGMTITNKDGDESHIKIFDYDLYPVKRIANKAAGVEEQEWYIGLPHGEATAFHIDSDALYDGRKFTTVISNRGLYPAKGNISHLQDYMVAYIAQLQQQVAAEQQNTHLGWTNDFQSFILPGKIMHSDGSVTPTSLSTGASRSAREVRKMGTLERQVELLKFYDRPEYLANQFFILAGLGAPLFDMTGHHGVILNASGDAGASKSTSLYTAASFWGQPEMYPINGTNNGATVRGRNERVSVLANLPVCVDEITHMPVKDAQDLAMSITQPGHRIRLDSSGVERAGVDSYKATMMLATANNSLHTLLSLDNAAGTAGSMRVFEITFRPTIVHQKWEADDYIAELKENFGHIGEAFTTHVLVHRKQVRERVRKVMREIDQECGIQSAERFWSAAIAVIIVAAEIARQLGLLSFDPVALRRWAVTEQVPAMRGVVKTEYSDPLGVLADYLAQIAGNTLIVAKDRNMSGTVVTPKNRVSGALYAHYDISDQQIIVLKKAFKEHCAKSGANMAKVIGELVHSRVIVNEHSRRSLGAGTDFVKPQAWCFVVNMAHPDVSGRVQLNVIDSEERDVA